MGFVQRKFVKKAKKMPNVFVRHIRQKGDINERKSSINIYMLSSILYPVNKKPPSFPGGGSEIPCSLEE